MAGTGGASSRGGELYELQDEIAAEHPYETDNRTTNISVASLPHDDHLRSRGLSLINTQGPGAQGSIHGPSASPRLHNGNSAIVQDDVVTAIASPSLYSSRLAARRFPNSTMYKDDDPDTTGSWITLPLGAPDHHPTGDARPAYSAATESSAFSHGPSATQHRASGTRNTHLAQAWRVSAYSDRSAYLWKKRRKRWARVLRNFALADGNTLSRPRLSVMIVATLLLLYLFFSALSTESIDAYTAPRPAIRVDPPIFELPIRKWWQTRSDPDSSIEHKRQKRTSYVTPRHTYSQLQSIPSRYAFNASSLQEMPSVRAIVECTQLDASDLSMDRLGGVLDDLDTRKMPFLSVDLIIRELAQPLLDDSKPRYTMHIASSARDYVHQVSKSHSSFLLLLDCPLDRAPAALDPDAATSGHLSPVETLLRAAGIDDYAGQILTLAGFSRRRGNVEPGTGLLARSANVRHELAGSAKPISSSTILQYASAPMLFHTSWLDQAEAQEVPELAEASSALYFGTILSRRRKIYGLPIPNRLSSDSIFGERWRKERLAIEAHSASARQQADVMNLQTARDASPARVAVFLADSDARHSDWEELICSFHDEQRHGHEIRLFLPPRSPSPAVGSMLGACPDVAYRRATEERLDGFKPDICLISQNATVQMDAECVRIVLPSSQVTHLDWLPTLGLESLQNWHTPQIDLIVVTNDRPTSLHRLLTSLSNAHYLSDRPSLYVNMEQTADDATQRMLVDAHWPFGQFILRKRIVHGGLLSAIVESWYPRSNDSYAVLLEDDTEVSPLFYAWIKYSILMHRYGSKSSRRVAQRLIGVSLYQPKNLELRPEGRQRFDAHQLFEEMGMPSTTPYLSQIPCSWGAVYFPEHWREFHQFLSLRLSQTSLDIADIIIPDIRSNRWPKSWKRYLNELIYLRGYTMLYPNFEDFRSLSTNHLELGTHVRDDDLAVRRRELFEVPLLSSEDSLSDGLPGGTLPSWTAMPVLDFWGGITAEGELLERAKTAIRELGLCNSGEEAEDPPEQSVDYGVMALRYDASDLLCARTIDKDDIGGLSLSIEDREAVVAEKEARLATYQAIR